MKKTLKMLGILGAASVVGAGYLSAETVTCPNALFTARGCETQRISIGGFIAANYQWVKVDDKLVGPNADLPGGFGEHSDPHELNNFYMKNIRLFVRADLCDNWTGFMSIDFAGRNGVRFDDPFRDNRGERQIHSSFDCDSQRPIFIDRAYIEKRWCSTTIRAGYQKVNFGAEEAIPDEYVKTVDRSVATNFFLNLGRRVVAGTYTPGFQDYRFGGHGFADRHAGIFLSGDACGNNFHYNLAVVNGFRGICRNSTQFNNELGYFAGVGYESCCCNVDVLIGLNAGYKPEGGNFTSDFCPTVDANNRKTDDVAVWGLNPYILANWNCLSILAEMLYGNVQNAKLDNTNADARPWGFNFIPSYMLSECWELVGRISYLNTNRMGTSIHNAFGSAPDHGNAPRPGICRADTFISSQVQFEKVTALYLGVNYYTVNQAVKATLGYEHARFKNPFFGAVGVPGQDGVGTFVNGQKALVNSVKAQLQLLF